MPSNPELKLISQVIDLPRVKVKHYENIPEIGWFIYLENPEKKARCPFCGKDSEKLHQNHHYMVRDLPWGHHQVYLKINRRQFRCQGCKKVFSESLEFVKKKRKYTERFQEKIIQELKESNIKNVAERNGLSEQEVETMLKDMGEELLEKKPKDLKRLGIDEIAIVKGQKNYYVILTDLDKKTIVGMVEKRTENELISYLESWGEEVLKQIQEVSIDLWKPYKKVVEKLMPQAEVIADRFHVMKQVNDELDAERRKVKKAAINEEDKEQKDLIESSLKKSKYALLKNEEDLTEEEKSKLEEVKKNLPNLGKMHSLKEEFRQIFEQEQNWVDGLFNLADWLKKADTYFPKSCGTVQRWIGEIIGYFDQGTTQGVVEGINNKLKLIKRQGYGFRNFQNFQLRCLLSWHSAC